MAWPLLLCDYLGGCESRLSFFINRARVNRWTLILQSKKYIYLIIYIIDIDTVIIELIPPVEIILDPGVGVGGGATST